MTNQAVLKNSWTGCTLGRSSATLAKQDLLQLAQHNGHDSHLIEIWRFAENIHASNLAEQVLELCTSCVDGSDYEVSPEGIKFVYTCAAEYSQLQERFLTAVFREFCRDGFGENGERFVRLVAANEVFSIKVMKKITEHIHKSPFDCEINPCSFHDTPAREDKLLEECL